MREKEQCLDGNKRKQRVMDKRFKSLTKQSIASPVKVSKSVPKNGIIQKHLSDSFFYENGISFNVADSSSFACMIEVIRREHEICQTKSFSKFQSPFQQMIIWGAP